MNNEDTTTDELATLKARADLLGLTYHPSIGLDKLRIKVSAAISGETSAADDEIVSKKAVEDLIESSHAFALRIKREALALVRVRVTCMNPAKKEWEGEIFTCGNSVIGSVKKYVPFDNSEGWHVPFIILQMMRDRMCQIFYTVTDSRGNKIRRGKLVSEFAIEVLPALTEEELAALALRQSASKSIDQ